MPASADNAAFVGGGPTFQIWERGRFKRHHEEMRARIRERGADPAAARGAMNHDAQRSAGHLPVLLGEAIAALNPRDGALYLDGTFGAGGYSRALLEAAPCRVVAFDRDPAAVKQGAELARRYRGRLTLIEGRFGEMEQLSEAARHRRGDRRRLDLGVSSMQLDAGRRGASPSAPTGRSTCAWRATAKAPPISSTPCPRRSSTRIIRDYGEERFARRVARAIVAARVARADHPHRGAGRAGAPRRARARGGIDAATRTFQALRIAVNDELGELERGLAAAERLLAPGGRLAVVSFHSLEDRSVKTFLRARSGPRPRASRHLPAAAAPRPSFRLIARKPIDPAAAEIAAQPARALGPAARRRTHGGAAWPASGEMAA